MNIALSAKLKAFVQREVRRRGYSRVSEYRLSWRNGEIIAHVTFFLLWHIPDYVTYAAPGQQYVIDMQVVMSHPALNLRSIMLLSFRASHAGEQHADYLLEDATDLGALSLRPRWSPS
jgi:hypothetical protein